MLKVLINNGDGNGDVDYTDYVLPGSISIQKSINIPTTCTISLVGFDNGFTVPVRHSYIKIYSTTNKRYLFTGFNTTEPANTFTGLSQKIPKTNFQMYQYNLSCTSDDYLLNIKSVPFIPAFINQTQGQIIKALAEILCPGYFNYDNIDDGDLVPYLAYDPTQSWYEYVQNFGNASRYRYSCINKQIIYKPYGDGALGITYDTTLGEGTFDPSSFSFTPLTTPMVNDVTVMGAEEQGNNYEDFFIGDGFTGAFPLTHKVAGLASNFQGSEVLLSDPWNSNQLNTQNWFAEDPAAQFNYADGALNIIAGFPLPLGTSYIYANNAVELAGSVIAQHGEVQFNDVSTGIIGGFYADQTLAASGCLAGFNVQPGKSVYVSISGASGIEMMPLYKGTVITSGAFVVTSQINKTYTMFTRISSPVPVRYYQVYRSLAGTPYGGYTTPQSVTGSITWSITETDIFSGAFTTWSWTASGAVIPDTVVYGLINNQQLNITLNSTELWTPPPASLKIGCEIGSGALGQFYLSGNVQYTGAFITPSGGNLPIYPNDIGPEQQFDLGSGIGNQAGEIDSGQQLDTLNIYSNDLPGVGVRLRLQSWESQVAVSRMQDLSSIADEAIIVGDNGIRATTVTNMSPLPRTSEDCDNAAAAFLADRVGTYYQGTYNANYYFFNQYSNDIEFYPACGRFLYVNAPNININKQNMLVTSITITVSELSGEILQYQIGFGPDTFLEKVLSSILPINQNVYQPIDTVIQPTPLSLTQLGASYLPDISQTSVSGNTFISGAQFYLALQDTLVSGGQYEIRLADWNWGQNDTYLVGRYSSNQVLLMPRVQYDQSWFIRMVSNVGTSGFLSSRRTKVIRIMYPRVPSPPVLLTADTADVQMDLSGDIRNIEGLELRQADDQTVVYQCIVGTRADTDIDMDLLRNQVLPGQQGLTGLGKYLVEPFASGSRLLQAHFFNLMWEYSSTLSISMPPFEAPGITLGYRWGSSVQLVISVDYPGDVNRSDFANTIVQIASTSDFNITDSTYIDTSVVGNPGLITVNAPVTGALYARAQFIDHVGSGAWSDTIYIPQGDLIASDYLAGQGSTAPVVLSNLGFAGGILAYNTSYISGGMANLTLYSQAFSVWFPNGQVATVPPLSGVFTAPLDVTGFLQTDTNYGFFPSLKGAVTANPTLEFNGPYANYTGSQESVAALTGAYADGSTPLTTGAFVCLTASSGTASGPNVVYVDIINGGYNYGLTRYYNLTFEGGTPTTEAQGQAISNGNGSSESGSIVSTAITNPGVYSGTPTVIDDGPNTAIYQAIMGTISGGGGGG